MSEDKPQYVEPTAGEGGMMELQHAAYRGDIDGVVAAMRGRPDLNAADQSGWTALHWLVDMGMVDGERHSSCNSRRGGRFRIGINGNLVRLWKGRVMTEQTKGHVDSNTVIGSTAAVVGAIGLTALSSYTTPLLGIAVGAAGSAVAAGALLRKLTQTESSRNETRKVPGRS